MTWNHTVMRRKILNPVTKEIEIFYSIHELFGTEGYTKESVDLGYLESVEDLRWTLEQMLKALDAPIMDYEEDEVAVG